MRLPFLIRLTWSSDSIWMSKLHKMDKVLELASSLPPRDLSPLELELFSEDDSVPTMRMESFRKLTGHSIVVSDSVGAGG